MPRTGGDYRPRAGVMASFGRTATRRASDRRLTPGVAVRRSDGRLIDNRSDGINCVAGAGSIDCGTPIWKGVLGEGRTRVTR